ncbi:DUF6894 family protein [Endobacterium cereale]|uniref:DUF6894 family protein n=1 Tax=Endobacterium cereale TaxID=2663029 RepID=UPI003B75CC02
MTRYYFHTRTLDVLEVDLEGTELASDDQAMNEAIAGACEIVADRVKRWQPVGHDIFEVMDDRGSIVFSLPFRSVLKLT